MKRFFTLAVLIFSVIGSQAGEPPMGKSMGHWTGFNLESMKANKAAGLEYIEVTMNDVIGKDLPGAPERAQALMNDIQEAGLKVWSVHMPYSRSIDISLIDDAKRAEAVQYLKDVMRVAGTFQPQYVVLHPSYEPIYPDEREDRLAQSHASIG